MDSIISPAGADVQPHIGANALKSRLNEREPARYRAYIHPCGTITVGLNSPKKKKDNHCNIQSRINKPSKNIYDDATSSNAGVARLLSAGLITVGEATQRLTPIGLSSPPNSRNESGQEFEDTTQTSGLHKPATRYGQNGISGRGKLRVKDGATIMQREYGRRSLAFATVTLPPMSPESMNLICESWGEFTHRLVEEIKRELARKNSPKDIIYCTEIQEKRYQKYGVVAPHLHLLWYAYSGTPGDTPKPAKQEYAISADWLRDLVARIINRITGESDVFTAASVDIQKVKKDAAGYLGKYMSKGGKIIQKIKEDGKQNLLPRQWWGITRELRNRVLAAIKMVDGRLASNIFYECDKLKKLGLISYHRYVYNINTSKDLDKTVYETDDITGEITWKTSASTDVTVSVFGKKCYGAVLQLSKKAMYLIPVFTRVVDICNDMSAVDVCDVAHWISAIKNKEMMEDFCLVLDNMKLIYWDMNYEAQTSGLHKPTTAYDAN
jgi:hypothetical protein